MRVCVYFIKKQGSFIGNENMREGVSYHMRRQHIQ